jgi:hypothetical protein
MATFVTVYSLVEAIAEKKHNFASDTLKWLLTNTAPVRTNNLKADIAGELSTGGGYTAGGATSAITSSSQTTGLYSLVLANPPTWTASGGGFGPFRYAVLYNDSAASDELIGYVDNGSSISRTAGQTFTVDLSPASGVLFTLQSST